MNESKPNSGWNESKPSFPIAMNVDEAMVYASKDKCFWAGEVHTALETLAAEIERLRAELATCQKLLDETRTKLSICGAFHSLVQEGWQLELEKVNSLEAELTSAKADGAMVEATVAENELLRVTNERLAADLAAAKAASVVPVKWKSAEQFFQSGADLGNQWGIEFWFDTKEQRERFFKWMKERGEG